MNKNGFFVIGGPKVRDADINIPDAMIKFPGSFSTIRMHTMSNFLLNAQKEIRAIGLLYERSNPFKDFVLSDKTRVIKLDENLIKILKKNLIDLFVYGGDSDRSRCDKCELIERIHSDYIGRKYVLREIETNTANRDVSLNRCAMEKFGFLPEMFKLGDPTPGKENDCTGPRFILEDNIFESTSATIDLEENNDEFEYQSCSGQSQSQQASGCSSSIPPSEYSQITVQSLATCVAQLNATSTTNECTNLLLNPDEDDTIIELEQANKRKRSISVDTDYSEEHEWTSTKFFR